MPLNEALYVNFKVKIENLKSKPEYLRIIAKWHHDEWAHLYPSLKLEKRINDMKGFLSPEFVPSTFVASINGKVVGSAAILETDMTTRKDIGPWLSSVFVVTEHRKQGIGSALVNHVKNEARINGYSHVFLFTEDQVVFYESLGWKSISNERYLGASVCVMESSVAI